VIDFRYHVVSLVAVFLALAVGIVLGAGPLREELSTTLEDQVAELRQERSALRAELEDSNRRGEAKDEMIRLLTGPVAAGRLTDIRVAMVLLPGTDRNLAETTELTVRRAGGQVVSTTELTDAWEDPESADTRHEVAVELSEVLADPAPRSGGDPTVATVLAAMLAGADEEGEVGQWQPAEWRLEELDLIETTWTEQDADTEEGEGPVVTDRRPADAVVLVSGGLTEEDAAEEPGSAVLEQRLDLVAALGAVELPTVVLSAGTDQYLDPATEQQQDTLVAAVRAEEEVAATVSSVDNGESPAGLLTVVLALGRGLQEEFGHWGLGPDAEGIAPPVPPVLEPRVDPTEEPGIPLPPEDQPTSPATPGDDDPGETSSAPTGPEELIPDTPTSGDATSTTGAPSP
jgi:Copper transport outer membrane protein, MctB